MGQKLFPNTLLQSSDFKLLGFEKSTSTTFLVDGRKKSSFLLVEFVDFSKKYNCDVVFLLFIEFLQFTKILKSLRKI